MRMIDLSQPLFDGCPNCPVHGEVKIGIVNSHAKDGPDGWHMEHLSFASHTGSHVDAPLHKLAGGDTLDDFPLERWTGPARIADLRGMAAKGKITEKMLAEKLREPVGDCWVLLATGFGDKRRAGGEGARQWAYEPPVLSAEGARWLAERGVRGVGVDLFSVGDAKTHAILLEKPVLIVEDLFFAEDVFSLQQRGEFWALPVNLRKASGGPCRPVLVVR